MAASAADEGAAGLNAKQRRLIRRAQERATAVAEGKVKSSKKKKKPAVPTKPPATPPTAADPSTLNAKQRRLLKRAQERGQSPAASSSAEDAAPSLAAAHADADAADLSGLNAKQRRLLKRAQERGEAPPPSVATTTAGAAAAAAAAAGGGKKRKRGGGEGTQQQQRVPHVVFVGQLSFKTTAEMLKAHLEGGGVTGAIQVRLRTDRRTGKSQGQAFVTLEDAERQFKCLALHHTKLDGRVINVERSCGGKNAGKRKERIQSRREEQREVLKTTCDRILQEKTEAGLLKEGELDEQARGLLTRYDGVTAAAVLEAYCNEDRNKLRNPSAFFMMLAKRVVEEGPEAVAAQQQKRAKERGGGGGGDGGDGGERNRVRREKGEGRRGPPPRQGQEGAVGERDDAEGGGHVEEEVEDEDEGRGWGVPHVAPLPPVPATTTSGSGSSSRRQHGGQRQGAGDEYYDLSQVFASVRGRGGLARGGGGGRGRFGGGGRGRGGERGGRR